MRKLEQQSYPTSTGMTRRRFLAHSLGLAALAAVPAHAAQALVAAGRKFRAAIIGHTGHGNYGHEHDLIFNGRENITVVGVADPDAAGRAQAVARSHALRS
jgi:hypothetical protein